MLHYIDVTPCGGGVWAVKDDDEGYLCFAVSQNQAVGVGRTMVDWFMAHGRPTELRVERSFAPDLRTTSGQSDPSRGVS